MYYDPHTYSRCDGLDCTWDRVRPILVTLGIFAGTGVIGLVCTVLFFLCCLALFYCGALLWDPICTHMEALLQRLFVGRNGEGQDNARDGIELPKVVTEIDGDNKILAMPPHQPSDMSDHSDLNGQDDADRPSQAALLGQSMQGVLHTDTQRELESLAQQPADELMRPEI